MATQAKVLIQDFSTQATEHIEAAQNALPAINALLAAWRAQGFEKDVTSKNDLASLLNEPEEWIDSEREKKEVPAALGGIDKRKFLQQFMAEPASVAPLREAIRVVQNNSINYDLIKYNPATSQFVMDATAVNAYPEKFKVYATGKQIKAIEAAQKIADSLNELHALGMHFTPYNLINWPSQIGGYAYGISGKLPGLLTYSGSEFKFYLQDKSFCMQVEAE